MSSKFVQRCIDCVLIQHKVSHSDLAPSLFFFCFPTRFFVIKSLRLDVMIHLEVIVLLQVQARVSRLRRRRRRKKTTLVVPMKYATSEEAVKLKVSRLARPK